MSARSRRIKRHRHNVRAYLIRQGIPAEALVVGHWWVDRDTGTFGIDDLHVVSWHMDEPGHNRSWPEQYSRDRISVPASYHFRIGTFVFAALLRDDNYVIPKSLELPRLPPRNVPPKRLTTTTRHDLAKSGGRPLPGSGVRVANGVTGAGFVQARLRSQLAAGLTVYADDGHWTPDGTWHPAER